MSLISLERYYNSASAHFHCMEIFVEIVEKSEIESYNFHSIKKKKDNERNRKFRHDFHKRVQKKMCHLDKSLPIQNCV